MFNPMQMAGRQIMANMQPNNPLMMLAQMRASGMTPQQAYERLMQNPQIVQSVNLARRQYPNMSFADIAKQNGIDVSQFGF